jgi:hypothetical protein
VGWEGNVRRGEHFETPGPQSLGIPALPLNEPFKCSG